MPEPWEIGLEQLQAEYARFVPWRSPTELQDMVLEAYGRCEETLRQWRKDQRQMNKRLQSGVTHYDVSMHIETPMRDRKYFLPDNKEICKLLTYGGIDPDTKGLEWQTYQWGGTFTVEQLKRLLDEYAIEERKTDPNLWQVPGLGYRIVECLDFVGAYPSPFLNAVTILCNPILEGLPQEVIDSISQPYEMPD